MRICFSNGKFPWVRHLHGGKMKVALTAIVLTLGFSQYARAEFWNAAQVLRTAQTLAVEVEHLDESLHDVKAPAHVIQKVHHFEETVNDFVMDIQAGASYQHALEEFSHIRLDVDEIRQELYAHPYLLQNAKVWTEWNAMRRAYRNLDHALYMFDANGQALMDDVASLQAEMAQTQKELDAHQAESK